MACAHDPTDPVNMSPDERLAEVAAIFAQGVLRLRQRSAVPADSAAVSPVKTLMESGQNRLDDCATTRPDGQRG